MGREFSHVLKNVRIESKVKKRPEVMKSIKIQSDSKYSKHDILNTFISELANKFHYLTEQGNIKNDFDFDSFKKSAIKNLRNLSDMDLPKYVLKFIHYCIDNDYRIGFSYGNYKMYALGPLINSHIDVLVYESLSNEEYDRFVPDFNEGDMITAIDVLDSKYGVSLKNILFFYELLDEYKLGNIPSENYFILKDNKKIAQYNSVLLENILMFYKEEIETDNYKEYYEILLKNLKAGHSIVYDV